MKIISNRENLVKGLQAIQSNVSAKTGTITILQNFLMETENGELKIVFTDLEMAVKHYIKVEVDKEGGITVPLKKFSDIVHILNPGEKVSINVDKSNKVSIVAGKAKFKLGGIAKTEYPVIPDVDEKNVFKIQALKLADYISNTIFSASNENERQFLNGLFFENEGKNFSIVATDGRRLAVVKDDTLDVKQNFKIIVPSKILNELVKFINLSDFDEKQEVDISLSENQIAFKLGKTLFVSRLIDGNFPDYEQIIPKKTETIIPIDVQKMLNLTRKAVICANERTGSVKYIFKKDILITQSSSQNMDFEDEMDIEYKGKDFDISFKPKYIMDILKTFNGGKLDFGITNPDLPVVINVENKKNIIYVIMPLRS